MGVEREDGPGLWVFTRKSQGADDSAEEPGRGIGSEQRWGRIARRAGCCDVVFIIRNVHVVFVPFSGTALLKPLGLWLYYVNEVSFGKHLKMGAGGLGNQPHGEGIGTVNPTPYPSRKGEGG